MMDTIPGQLSSWLGIKKCVFVFQLRPHLALGPGTKLLWGSVSFSVQMRWWEVISKAPPIAVILNYGIIILWVRGGINHQHIWRDDKFWKQWWLHNITEVLNVIELYTSKWLTRQIFLFYHNTKFFLLKKERYPHGFGLSPPIPRTSWSVP